MISHLINYVFCIKTHHMEKWMLIVQVLNIILMYSKPEVCNYRFTLILHVKWTLRIICIRWMCFSFIILWLGIQIERVGLSNKCIIIKYYYRYIFLYVNFNNKVWIITYECLRSRIYLYLHILSSPNIRAHCINHHCDMQCIISQRGSSLLISMQSKLVVGTCI